jgi:hypothetical protein
MAIRSRVAVVSAVILFVQLLAAQRAPEPKAVQPDVQRHIEKVISCLPAAVVIKDDPHSCTTLAQQMAALHVSGVSIAVIHNGSIEKVGTCSHKRHHCISADQHQSACPPAYLHRCDEHGYAAPIVAKARTGNVPIPFTLTGTAVKLKPLAGNCSRLHICSTIGIPARSRIVWTGRVPSVVSSML